MVGGEFGGRRILAPHGRGVRPTLDRVREAIFDVLGSGVEGAKVLDLFAGSGALGIEALSRGACHVTFCDSSSRAVQAIHRNLERLGIRESQARVLQMPAAQAIRVLANEGDRFDIVFVDPPYDALLYEATLTALAIAKVVTPGGRVIVEHSRRTRVGAVYGDLQAIKTRRYGDTCVTFFERAPKNKPQEEVP